MSNFAGDSLRDRYINLSDQLLMDVLKAKKGSYTKEAIQVAAQILIERGVLEAALPEDLAEEEVSIKSQKSINNEAAWWQRVLQLIADGLIVRGIWFTIFYLYHPDEQNAYYGISLIASLSYFFLTEGFFSKTIGMAILNIKIVNERDKQPISWETATVRTIGRLLCSLTLGIGYIFLLHDKLAKTVVVNN